MPHNMEQKTIAEFSGDYYFLSNFFPAYIKYEGLGYNTTENAFQAAKTEDYSQRCALQSVAPGKAKRYGRNVTLRPDWEFLKDGIMLDLLRQKFAKEPLREKLIATGDAKLVEGNQHGDVYWGVCNGTGLNKLGELLMKVRGELVVD